MGADREGRAEDVGVSDHQNSADAAHVEISAHAEVDPSAESVLKKQLYDDTVDGGTDSEEQAKHLMEDRKAEIESDTEKLWRVPGKDHEDAVQSMAADQHCSAVHSQANAVEGEPMEESLQDHLRHDTVALNDQGCNAAEVPVEMANATNEDERREQVREGEEMVNMLQEPLETYHGAECTEGAEEEEYDEDPFLGEEPSGNEEENDDDVAEQPNVAQVEPDVEPRREEADSRNTTAEADSMNEGAHEEAHTSEQNKNEEVGREHHFFRAETKDNLSMPGNMPGNAKPERRRSGPQAPIVWEPSALRPKSLFEHHQRLLDVQAPTYAEKQDFGAEVPSYRGRKLNVSIAAEYAIGLRRPAQGKSKRHIRFGAGQLELEGCPELPSQESRKPLQFSGSSSAQRRLIKWNRRVTFTAKLKQGEKVEYVYHGDCINVRLVNLPTTFWYSASVTQRFIVDPAEIDAAYEAGVAKVELGMRVRPEQWAAGWINANVSRVARAQALRSFMKKRSGEQNPASFYYHFVNLCKGIQKLNPPIRCDESEKAYERGCARTVGCATAETFEALTALPKDTIFHGVHVMSPGPGVKRIKLARVGRLHEWGISSRGDVIRALGMELCTPELCSGKAGVDARLYALIKTHCPPHCFRDVVCYKAGQLTRQRSQTDVPRRTADRIDRDHVDVQSAGHRARGVMLQSTRTGFRAQNGYARHDAVQWDRKSARCAVRGGSACHQTDYNALHLDRQPHVRGIRGTARARSRPCSPTPLRQVAQDSKHAAVDRLDGGHKSHAAVTYPGHVLEDESGWVRGRTDAEHESRTHKSWGNLRTQEKYNRPSGMAVMRSGERGAAQNGTRVDVNLYPGQRATETGRRASTFRLGVDGEVELQRMHSECYNLGKFVQSRANHSTVQSDVGARRGLGDLGVREGRSDPNSYVGVGEHGSSVTAQFVENGPIPLIQETKARCMAETVSTVGARKFPASGREVGGEPQGYAISSRIGVLAQQEKHDLYSHEIPPRRTYQQEAITLEEKDLPLPPPPQKKSLVAARDPGPSTRPVYRAVQNTVPAAPAYDANQFQAAVTQAVQEVVKRLGVPVPSSVPEAAAAIAVQDMRTAAPRERSRDMPASTSLQDAQLLHEAHYAVTPRVVHSAGMHAARDSRLAKDSYGLRPTHARCKHPPPPHGKRPRDAHNDDPYTVCAPLEEDPSVRKVYCRETQVGGFESVRQQPTRYPDVEIVPDVSIISTQNVHEYARQLRVSQDAYRGTDTRGEGGKSRFDDHGTLKESQQHRVANQSFRDLGPDYGQGNLCQPKDARPGKYSQDRAPARVGGFLNSHSRLFSTGLGSHQAADTQRSTRALQAGAQGKGATLPAVDMNSTHPSRWSSADMQPSNRDPVLHDETYASDTHLQSYMQLRQSSEQAAQGRKGSMQKVRGSIQNDAFQQHERNMQPQAAQQPVPAPGSGWQEALQPPTGMVHAAAIAQEAYKITTPGKMLQISMNDAESEVVYAHDHVTGVTQPESHTGAHNAVSAPTLCEAAQGAVRNLSLKLRSGGSRVACSGRTTHGSCFHTVENEDAFAVGSCCFAVGDGLEQMGSSGAVLNSGKFAHELVSTSVSMAAGVIQEVVHGRRSKPVDPKAVLQQATNATQSPGAAAVLLGSLDPFTGVLSLAKMGDVGYLVLRPGASLKGDLEAISNWLPYTVGDHPGNDFSDSYYFASRQLRGKGTWEHDCHTDSVLLQPSDIIVAGTDGLWDAVHFFGPEGLGTRRLVRDLYLVEQLDPGQLAEKLLLRAWGAVQDARTGANQGAVPPFLQEVYKRKQQHRLPVMPEDDIAVVVSYVLQA